MLISQIKKKENIAEYILYMWQIEDFIRGFNFDINMIEKHIIEKTPVEDEIKSQIRSWYLDLMNQMSKEDVREVGHLSDLREIVGEMYYLHNMLQETMKDEKYIELYKEAKDDLEDFAKRSRIQNQNTIDIALHALYSKLLLKLKGNQISPETDASMQKFSKMIAYLASKYKSIYQQ